MVTHDILSEGRAALADLDARRARLRSEAAASPLGRYRSGQAAARDAMAADRRAEQAAVAWAVRVGALLRALHDDDEDAARTELAGLPADDVTDLQTAAETLTRLCTDTATGRRA